MRTAALVSVSIIVLFILSIIVHWRYVHNWEPAYITLDIVNSNVNKGCYMILIMDSYDKHLVSLKRPDLYVPAYSFYGSYYTKSSDEEKITYCPEINKYGYGVVHSMLDERLLFVVFLDNYDLPFILEKTPPYTQHIKYYKSKVRNKKYPVLKFTIKDINQMTPLPEYKYSKEVKEVLDL